MCTAPRRLGKCHGQIEAAISRYGDRGGVDLLQDFGHGLARGRAHFFDGRLGVFIAAVHAFEVHHGHAAEQDDVDAPLHLVDLRPLVVLADVLGDAAHFGEEAVSDFGLEAEDLLDLRESDDAGDADSP